MLLHTHTASDSTLWPFTLWPHMGARTRCRCARAGDFSLETGIGPIIAGHVHRGAQGVNGPIAVLLFAAPNNAPSITDGDTQTFQGCVPEPDDIGAAIADAPNQFYVNVHSTKFSGGALRGQIYQG
jgi:CHRD domain